MNLPSEKFTDTIECSNLEEAALILTRGFEPKSASINERGYVSFTFDAAESPRRDEYLDCARSVASLGRLLPGTTGQQKYPCATIGVLLI